MVNYKDGKIYKIVNDINDKFYIGSTAQEYLSSRMATHMQKHSMCMSKNLDVDLKECSIILIENYPCKDRPELLRKEREYFDKYKKECKEVFVNKNRPIITKEEKKQIVKEWNEKNREKKKEYNEKNKEILKQMQKEWYENNKIRILKQKKEYRETNKEEIAKKQKVYNSLQTSKDKTKVYREKMKEVRKEKRKEYEKNNKEKINKTSREWREKNKDKIRENTKQNYEKNKDKIKERKKTRVICECGCNIAKGNTNRHKKTEKHIKLMELLQ